MFIFAGLIPVQASEPHLSVLDSKVEVDDLYNEISDSNLYETPISLDEEHSEQQNLAIKPESESHFYSFVSKTAKDIYELQVENTNVVNPLFKEQLTWNVEKGPIDNIHLWGSVQSNAEAYFPEKGDSDVTYRVSIINVLLDSKLNDGKEDFSLMLDVSPSSNYSYMQRLVQDAYIQTNRVAHHRILFGNSRPGVGIEGEQSPYTLPLWSRSQISRNFSAVRKVGVKVRGDYSYVAYNIGGYSSDTFFSEFMPGGEFDGWVNVKPLAKTDGRFGKVTAGGGVSAGERHNVDYLVSGAYLGYEYKKLWLKAEYANGDGSNGATGLTSKHREGWYATLGYKLNRKLELIARYDVFDQDKKVANNDKREYSAGVNYYIKGQALKFVLNYIYCQTQNKLDSHRLMFGTQLIL